MSESPETNKASTAGGASLADMIDAGPPSGLAKALPRETLVKIGLLAVAFLAMRFERFDGLVKSWLQNPNWSFGFIIPLFSIYLLYARRQELLQSPRRVCLWGLPVVVLSLMLEIYARRFWKNEWISEIGMVFVIFGLVLYLAGPKVTRLTWLPILYLILAMPVPGTVYESVASQLQNIAGKASVATMKLFGAGLTIVSSNITITSVSNKVYNVTIAEACSGLRSLVAYIALSVALAYLTDRPLWQRLVLVIAAIPIAIACNVLRVIGTCYMYVIDKPELGQDFMHTFMGMLVMIPALLMFWLLIKVMQSLVVEEDEETPDASSADTSAGAKP